ncbi:3D domain-containing protein [Clostridium tyrobutyricum]|uniref:3D domain-containing protein n=1 Tax=Clostridium tyrobutyricum TaxID=1519 RepID=UPI0005808DA3|nr:3D domain-containing protein [Clostridium tyrobutyricum]
MSKKMLSSIITSVIISVMISVNVFAASDTLKQTQDNKAKLQVKVQNLNTQISSVISKIDENKKQMNAIAENMKNTQDKLNRIQKETEESRQLFNKRARAMYMSGTDGYIGVLFGSSDIGDFLSRVDTISKIMKFDNGVINKLKNDQQAISNQKQKLVAENNRLQTLRLNSQNTLAKLSLDVKEQKQLLANASAKEKELIAADMRAKEAAKAKADAIAQTSAKKTAASKVLVASNSSSSRNSGNSISVSRGTSTPSVEASTITVQATAYTGGGYTASGRQAAEGVIAVDPTVIPLGSRVYVDGYGYAVAADTGGAIQGNIIDLYFSSQSACENWGRRTVTVHILK